MTENKRFNDLRGYKRFDSYFDDCMQLWTVSDNENDNMLYPCTSENMANEFTKLLNKLNDENNLLDKSKMDMADELGRCIDEIEQLKQKLKKLEEKENCRRNEKIEWALNQFRYMEKTSEQMNAFMIIENELNKR